MTAEEDVPVVSDGSFGSRPLQGWFVGDGGRLLSD